MPSHSSTSGRSGVGVPYRRTSYPSGSWVDRYGNATHSPNNYDSTPTPQPFTITKPTAPEPKPDNWKIVEASEVEGFLILTINYPDCKNYEGNKILVFEDLTLVQLVNQRLIDPHFFEDSKFKSPIARFEPTKRGREMAQAFVSAWSYATKAKGKR